MICGGVYKSLRSNGRASSGHETTKTPQTLLSGVCVQESLRSEVRAHLGHDAAIPAKTTNGFTDKVRASGEGDTLYYFALNPLCVDTPPWRRYNQSRYG